MDETKKACQMYSIEYKKLPNYYSKREKHDVAINEAHKKCKAMIDACKLDKQNENYKFNCKVYIILSTIADGRCHIDISNENSFTHKC